MTYAAITGWGIGLPARTVTNAELARMVPGVDEEWIVRRTGIRERRIAGPSETTASLAVNASLAALARAGISAADLDLIVVATCTPDHLIPPTAPMVQAAIGARKVASFDVNGACAGFLVALATSDALVRCGAAARALVVGADTLSRVVDWQDRKTSVLFGDGAGAVVIERSESPAGLLSLELGADGDGANLLLVPAGGSARPATLETVGAGEHAIRMNGAEVFRAAVRLMAESAERALAALGLSPLDTDLLVLHQANQRIIAEAGARFGLPAERVFSNVARYGNTSAASIPIAICEAAEQGLLHPGARLVLGAVGAGLSWGAGVVHWTAATTEEHRPDAPAEPVGARS